ncbi:CCA tRNA nucleotidyltransferase, partial [Nymphaea thermarum]
KNLIFEEHKNLAAIASACNDTKRFGQRDRFPDRLVRMRATGALLNLENEKVTPKGNGSIYGGKAMKALSFLARPFAHPPIRLGILPRRLIAGHSSSRRRRVGAIMALCTRVQVKDRIELTEKERKIFDRLLQVLRHFELKTELRVAGGWVRDKLLSKDCYDIDIALDNMLGREFCEKVNEYSVHVGEERQGVGVIHNPDQSKHLETARMRVFDVWIDFVNLRSETYTEHSRIPAMKFGTAEEDAYRRDLTINSLFYNINTDTVEDLTGRGIEDLKEGTIATPLPPKATFLDDPLRVLRAIRFGARFGFHLHEELKRAASDDEVKAAVSDKVSKERIGHEVDLMVSGNQPVKAMTYIYDLELFWTVFGLPEGIAGSITDDCDR